MPVITTSIIAGSAALVGLGAQAWYNNAAQKEALGEHRRSENLRIKFAAEETEREESRFNKNFKQGQIAQNFNMTQTILNNSKSMFESNRNATNQLVNFNRGRS